VSTTVAELLRRREHDDTPGLRFEERGWTWADHVAAARARAAWLHRVRDPDRPFHVGVLLDNVPEFSFLLGAAALGGAVVVGLNPTRRGAALARDVRHSDCQVIVTESRHRGLLDGLDLGVGPDRVYDIDAADWVQPLRSGIGAGVPSADRFVAGDPRDLRGAAGGGAADLGAAGGGEPDPDDLLMLIFTSGTDGDPKAVRCTHHKVVEPGIMLAERMGLSGDDCAYLCMPLFHSNAVMAGWAVALASGATIALRRSFSASGFLPDVRRFDATYATYVGKPLSYVLATPERPDDADNPLRIVYGNEGAERDLAEFGRRFGCHVVDGFGSTEGGVAVSRVPGSPPGSLGVPADGVRVLDPATGRECPDARFDHGVLANPDEAVGELVNTTGPGAFAGYYNQPDADAARMRDGMYWSGDLAYRDADGYLYFAGRSGEWLRVDGENLGTAPIERLLLRHDAISQVAVYAVPDPVVGDQVMAAVVMRDGAAFDPDAFGAFLAAQPDLGTKQAPRYVRVCADLPRGRTYKVLKRDLAAQGCECTDPVWQRTGDDARYRRLTRDETGRP
jgi:fatty-acyl-CoA synthase